MFRKFVLICMLGVLLLVAATAWGRGTGKLAGVAAGADMGGKIVYVRSGALWMYTGGEQKQLTAGPKDRNDKRDAFPSISPDGSQVIYTRVDEGYSDLYKLDIADPSSPVALTDYKPDVEVGQAAVPGVSQGYNELALWADYPAWSPDGKQVAFTSDVGTEYPNLRVMDPDGTRASKLAGGLDFSQQTVEHPSWSPDGRKIAVANYSDTNNNIGQIWVYNLSTEQWIAITNSKEGAYDPSWSPDGNWIAFTMRENGANNVYAVPTDATKWTGDYPTPVKLTTDGASRSPAWSPDTTRLAFLTLKGTSFDLYASDFNIDATGHPSIGQPQQLTDGANIDAPSAISWGQ